jgi:hypothetical protein
VVENLLRKHEALHSNTSTEKDKDRETCTLMFIAALFTIAK